MNFNKVLLAGHLTREPQLSYTPSQTAVVAFGLAVNRDWTDKAGTKQKEVCFIDCEAWAGAATNINKYVKKGDPLFVEGYLKLDQWTAQDGTKRSKHKMVVQSFQFIPRGEKKDKPESATPSPAMGGAPTESDIPF